MRGVASTEPRAPWASSSHPVGSRGRAAVPTCPHHSPFCCSPGLPPAGSSGPASGWRRPPLSPGPRAASAAARPAAPVLCVAPAPAPAALPEPRPAPGGVPEGWGGQGLESGRDLLSTESRAAPPSHQALTRTSQSRSRRRSPSWPGLPPSVQSSLSLGVSARNCH